MLPDRHLQSAAQPIARRRSVKSSSAEDPSWFGFQIHRRSDSGRTGQNWPACMHGARVMGRWPGAAAEAL